MASLFSRVIWPAALTSAMPLLLAVGIVVGAHHGLVNGSDIRFSFFPKDAILFGLFFSIGALSKANLSLGMKTRQVLVFVAVCVLIRSVNWFIMMIGMWMSPLFFLTAGIPAALLALCSNMILGFHIRKWGVLRVSFLGAVMGGAGYWFLGVEWFTNDVLSLLGNSSWYLPIGLAIMYEELSAKEACPVGLNKSLSVNPVEPAERRKFTKWHALLAFGIPLAGFSLLLLSAILGYDGYCYGFTDDVWQCSLMESITHQMSFSFMFFIIPAVAWAAFIVLLVLLRLKKK